MLLGLLAALNHLRTKGIMHRDLKSHNLLHILGINTQTKARLRLGVLADFGHARLVPDQRDREGTLTPRTDVGTAQMRTWETAHSGAQASPDADVHMGIIAWIEPVLDMLEVVCGLTKEQKEEVLDKFLHVHSGLGFKKGMTTQVTPYFWPAKKDYEVPEAEEIVNGASKTFERKDGAFYEGGVKGED